MKIVFTFNPKKYLFLILTICCLGVQSVFGIVTNLTTANTYPTIQAAVNTASPGDILNVSTGTYLENVVVNVSVTIRGNGGFPNARPIVAGNVSAQVIQVAAPNVTIENLEIAVAMVTATKTGIASTISGSFNNVTVKDNFIYPTGAFAFSSWGILLGTFGGASNDQITVTNNVVVATSSSNVFGRGLRLWNWYGTVSGNNFLGAYSAQMGDNGGGLANITNNTFNGQCEVNNLGFAGTHTINSNSFNPTSPSSPSSTQALLELKNLSNPAASLDVMNNNFNNIYNYGLFAGRVNNVFVDNNIFDANPSSPSFRLIHLNTKQATTAVQSAFVSGISVTNNIFSGNLAAGQQGYAFEAANYDNVSSFGTITIGTSGNTNSFDNDIYKFISLNNETGAAPAAGPFWGGAYASTMVKTNVNIDGSNNMYNVGFGYQLPASMTLARLFLLEDKTQHGIDDSGLGFVSEISNNSYVTPNSFYSPVTTTPSVQRGVDISPVGYIVNIQNGSYLNQDVNVNKALTLDGESRTGVILQGTYAGSNAGSASTLYMSVNNGIAKDMTITRDYGANLAAWQASGKNQGVVIGNGTTGVSLDNLQVKDQRNAVYLNNCQSFSVTNCDVHDSRTGFQLGNNNSNGIITNNFIHDNFTHGLLVNFSLGTTDLTNLQITNNSFTGNWFSHINFNTGGSYNVSSLNVNCNWYGTTGTSANPTNTSEPGYATQTPTQFGGTNPGAMNGEIRGTNAGLVTYSPWLINGTDNAPGTNGFQPVPGSCLGTAVVITLNSQTNLQCFGDNNGAIDINVTGGGGTYNYSWSNLAITQDISGLVAGTYTVTVTDITYGSTASASYSITQPAQLLVTATNTSGPVYSGSNVNFTSTVTGGTVAYTYAWTGGPNILPTNSPTPSITGATASDNGIYTLTITDANLCVASDTAKVIVYGPDLYVNDAYVPSDDHYTTAVGSNSNPGTPSAPFATIAYAISVAQAGNTIYVDAGTYSETPTINKSLTIKGSNFGADARIARAFIESVVRPSGNQNAVFTVTSSNVVIDGFTIDGDDPSTVGGSTYSGADANSLYGVRPTGAINNLNLSNNIIKRVAIGLRGDVGVAQGSVINKNWFDEIGNYDFGYAVSLRNDFYADITNNKMTKCWTGVHLNNHHTAGGPASWTVSNNEIHSYSGGILYWLQYQNATGLTCNNNQVSAESGAVINNFGILIVSNQDAISSSFTNNSVTGTEYGIGLFNVPTSNTITIGSTNSISGTTNAGIFLTNNLNFNPIGTTNFMAGGPGAASTVSVNGITMTSAPSGNGIKVDASSTPNTTQTINVSNTTMSGGNSGVVISGALAIANLTDNAATITGFVIGVDVDGGSGMLFQNNITLNGTGVRVKNGGTITSTTENFITNNTLDGLRIEATAAAMGPVNNNDFSGNGNKAILNQSANTFNATCNWFGSNVPATVAASVSGPMTYTPYLSTGVDNDANPANGFQPVVGCSAPCALVLSTSSTPTTCPNNNNGTATVIITGGGSGLYSYLWSPGGQTTSTATGLTAGMYSVTVTDLNNGCTASASETVTNSTAGPVHNISTGFNYCTIQAAINAASNTNIITVDPGTYPENLTLNKSLTLQGNQSGVNACGRSAVESIISGPSGVGLLLLTGSAGSVIDGFTFSGFARTIESNSGPLDNMVIKNNRFIGFTNSAMFLNDNGTDITINQNSIDGTSCIGTGGLIHFDTDQFPGLYVTNNCITNGVNAPGLFVDGNRNVGSSTRNPLMQGNLFQNCNVGVNGGIKSFQNAQIIENTFNANLFDGFQGGPKNSFMDRNTFSNNARYGLALTGFSGNAAQLIDVTRGAQGTLVRNNFFFANTTADVRTSDQAAGTQNSNSITENSLLSTTAISNAEKDGGTDIIHATCNWFGTVNPVAIAAKISNVVGAVTLYTPWLTSGTDNDLVTAGFQPSVACAAPCALLISTSTTPVTCPSTNNGTATVNVVSGGSGTYTYLWTPGGQTTQTATGLTAAVYTVTVTDQNGCTSSSTATVQYMPVTNTSNNTSFPTIQSAIDAATTANGETIEVCAGTYNENVVVSKELTINGPNDNVDCTGARAAEANVVGLGGTNTAAIKINANSVTLNGLSISNPTGSYGVAASGRSNLNVIYNIISNIGNNVNGSGPSDGIQIESNVAANIVNLSHNCINNIRGGTNGPANGANGSGFGIGINSTTSTSSISGLVISYNVINNISASTTNGTGGKGAYGVIINVGATVGGIGQAIAPLVSFNTIFSLNGRWAHGVGMEGDSPNGTVDNNAFSNFTSIAGDNTAVRVEDDDNAGSLAVNNNSFLTGGFGIVNSSAGTVNGTCNWYGSANAAAVAAGNVGPVTFSPWLTSGGNSAPIGFQPTSPCNGTPVVIASATANHIHCGPTTGSIDVTWSGGVGPFGISWTGPSGGSASNVTSVYNITPLGVGSYTVTVTDVNGSTATATATIFYQPVSNTSDNTFFTNIQSAIDTASTGNGETIEVCAGTYNENVNVSKALTINGPNDNVDCTGARAAEANVVGLGGSGTSAIIITSDNVTLNGLSISNPNGSYGVSAGGRSTIAVIYNIISNIGNNVNGSGPSDGIQFESNATANTVNLSHNCINNIRGGTNGPSNSSNGSGIGIGVNSSGSTASISGLVISFNVINNISASTTNGTGGKGAYGVIINVGASLAGTGQAIAPLVSFNTINNLNGRWAHGVGMEGDSPNGTVENNDLSSFTSIAGDNSAVYVEDDDNSGSLQVHNNSFLTGGFGIKNVTTGNVNGTCNWYGSANAAAVAAGNSGPITYSPWLTSGANSAPIGFSPTGLCNGTPVVIASATANHIHCGPTTGSIDVTWSGGVGPFGISWTGPSSGSASNVTSVYNITPLGVGSYTVTVTDVNGSTATATATIFYQPVSNTSDNTFFTNIQSAIDTASTGNGETIEVCAGTYNENVNVSKALTINGPNDNVDCSGARAAEANVVGLGGSGTSAIIITSDNVTLNGLSISNPNGSYGVSAGGRSTIAVIYNIISNIGNNVNGSGPSDGIQFESNATANAVNLSHNCINNIRGGTNGPSNSSNGSGIGIGVNSSGSTASISGLVISYNVITNISASTTNGTGGKGAYGVIINVGASLAGTGQAIAPLVSFNTINNLNGRWAHGVGMEGDSPNGAVENNDLSSFTSIAGDNSAVYVEDDDNSGSLQVHNNSFLTGGFGIKNVTTGNVNGTCNWYGSANAAAVAAGNSGPITYSPWLTSGANSAPIGFSPTGLCNGTPVVIASATANHIHCGPTTGSIDVTWSGGVGPFGISWTGPSSGSASNVTSVYNITPLGVGSYTVTVTDVNGSTATATATIFYQPVSNTSDNTFFTNIQSAIDTASTGNGETIEVCAGTYNENVNVSKALTINGPNDNVDCSGARAAEANVVGLGGSGTSAIIITSDNVTLNGLSISNPNGSYGVSAGGRSNIAVIYNIISNIGNNVNGSGPSDGIQFESNATSNAVNLSHNCINNIRGGTNGPSNSSNGSGIGIGVNSSGSTSSISGLVVSYNVITNISASTTNGTGGKGAYGVIINVGASLAGTGQAIAPLVSFNTINNLNGRWAHGVGMEGDSPNGAVENNDLSSFTSIAGDNSAVYVEDDDNSGSLQVHNNSFLTGGFGIKNVTTGTVNGTCNWYGSTVPAVVATKVSGPVTYVPYLNSGINLTTGPGFLPAGTCSPSAPVFDNCTSSVVLNCGDPLPPVVNPTASSPCSPNSTATIVYNGQTDNGPQVCQMNLIYTRSWTATDACGNTSTCTQNITFAAVNPSLTGAPYPGTTGTNACKANAATAAPFNATNATQGYSASCGGPVSATLTNTNVTGSDCNWTVTYTFTIKDACNNSLTGQTYSNTGHNQNPPSLTGAPYPGTIGTNACKANAATAAPFSPFDAMQGYTDNCGNPVTQAILTNTNVTGSDCNWTVTYTFTIKDFCDNPLPGQTYSNTGSDQTAPSLTGIAYPGTTGTNDCMSNAATAAPFNASNAIQGYTDNCGDPVTATLTNTNVTGSDCNWTVTYTFTVKDFCGNSLTGRTYSNTGSDQTAPTVTAGVIASCYSSVAAAEAAAKAATSATDNCSSTFTKTASTVGACNAAITVTVFDVCLNSASVVYHTNIDIPIALPPNVVTNVPAVFYASPPLVVPTVLDVCGNPINPVLTIINNPNPIVCTGTRVYSYTYTNCSGGTGTWTFTYIVDLNDDDACTIDACNTNTGIVSHTQVNRNDGDACTFDGCDAVGGVFHIPANTNDNDVCTSDACNTTNGVISHSQINTNDGNACTLDGCNSITGIFHNPATVPSDNNLCTTDGCDPSTGFTYTPLNTNDNNICTADGCISTSGVFHNNVPTDDFNVCTTDGCDVTIGVFHNPVNIDDGNVCTTDACNSISGQSHTNLNTDDGDLCTADGCNSLTGVFHNQLAVPSDNSLCTTDGCNPATGFTYTPVNTNDNNICTADGCVSNTGVFHTNVPTDDFNVCTTDGCDVTIGVFHNPVNIDDGNVCTTDACNSISGQSHTNLNTDDGDACTADGCNSLTGIFHNQLAVPSDNNLCTTDGCNPATGFTYTPVNSNDNNICTADGCISTTGVFNTLVPTNDGNICTTDGCDVTIGVFHNPVNIDDGNVCTTDACNSISGQSHTNLNTDDGDLCTADGCNSLTGIFHNQLAVPSDNNLCTTDGCNPATGFTYTPVNTNDNNICTKDGCVSSTGVFHTPENTDDLDPCTFDGCDQAIGVFHNPVNTNDNNVCTTDGCDSFSGAITHDPLNTSDGDLCTADGCNSISGIFHNQLAVPSDNSLCTTDGCNPATGFTYTPVNVDDNNICTADGCISTSGVFHNNVPTNDGDVCTTDGCDVTIGVFHNPVNIDDGNVCTTDACNSISGQSHTNLNTDDGDLCTTDGCNSLTGTFHNPIVIPSDNNLCTTDGCDPRTGPTYSPVNTNDNNICTDDGCVSNTGVFHNPYPVNDNNACTTDGCDASTGVYHTPVIYDDNNACTIDACHSVTGVSHTNVNTNDGNACTTDGCDPQNGIYHTPVAVTDNNQCTLDYCDPVSGVYHVDIDIDDNDNCTIDECDPSSGAITHDDNSPQVTATPGAIACYNGTGCVNVTATGGVPPYIGAGQQCGYPAGTYSFLVADAQGCIASSAPVTLNQPVKLEVTTTKTDASCAANDGTATANATGGTIPYSYLWTPGGQTTQTAIGLAPGMYTVKVTDANGCTTSATANVGSGAAAPPAPGPISGPTAVCKGQCYTYSIAPVPGATSYTWTLPNGATGSSTSTSITICLKTKFSGPGYLCVRANSSCGSSGYTCITLNPVLNKPATPSSMSGTTSFCATSSTNETYCISSIPGATSYVWAITGNANPPLTIQSGQGTTCIVVTIPAGYPGNQYIKVYGVNCKGNGGYLQTKINRINTPAQPGSISGSSNVCKTDVSDAYSVSNVTGATSYNWTISGGATISGNGTPNITVNYTTSAGTSATLSVTASNACGTSIARTKAITINQLCKVAANAPVEGSTEIGITSLKAYPNPTHGKVVVSFNAPVDDRYSIMVRDVLGKVLMSEDYVAIEGLNEREFSFEGLAEGMYFITLQTEGKESHTLRIIVE